MNYNDNVKSKINLHPIFILLTIIVYMLIASIGSIADADTYGYRNIIFDGKSYKNAGYYYKGTPYVKAQSQINFPAMQGVTIDNAGKAILIDAAKANINMADKHTTDFVKNNAGILQIPFATIYNQSYIPLNTAADFLGLSYHMKDNNIILTTAAGNTSVNTNQSGQSIISLNSLYADDKLAGITRTLSGAADFNILSETDNMYYIQHADGVRGYVMKFDIKKTANTSSSQGFNASKKNKELKRNPSIAWHYVNKFTPEAPDKKAGIDIMAPTWFSLNIDSNGSVNGKADKGYTDMAHQNGYKVWATISNSMSHPNAQTFTHQMMTNEKMRDKSIAQFLFYAALYDVDGINIDFEKLMKADRDNLVSYTSRMREFTERQGLVLSIDVMVPSKWSTQYNRAALSKSVDYIALMAYDEHYRGSSKAGSVASIPWVERAIKNTLDEGVPGHKLLLGVPLYTRLWEVSPSGTVISAKTKTMEETKKLIAQYFNDYGANPIYSEKHGQNYLEYKTGENTYKLWLEDQVSMKNRIALIKKYNLAGIAGWQYEHADNDIWNLIAQGVQ